ncbi:pyocin knob domain-containing protein [Pilosibacter fragilis]|uniref:pyocin knob domain-containing protein n=1 Tax=Pilosibacter fragilis TaxID=3078042 RepID=UPI0031BA3D4A
MGVYRAAIVTENGQNLIAQALANEKPLIFTSAKTSSYSYPVGTDVPALTGLQDVVQSVLPFDSKVLGGNVAQVSVRFDNDGVDQTYRIETIGLYAKIEGGAETLFSVTQATTPDEMPVQSDISPSAYIYNIQHTVQNASQITLTVNPAGTATVQDIMDIESPEFDDSGTVEGISSFPSFLEAMKSRMNFFQFFRNLKAGLQFVLHAGQIVNNCVTDNAGLPLSAAQGKVLKDLYTQLYSDLNTTNNNLSNSGIPIVKKITDLYSIKTSGFYYYDAGATNAPLSSRGGMIIANYLSDSWISLIVVPYASSKIYTNTKYNNTWVGWAESATKDDLPNIFTAQLGTSNLEGNHATTIKGLWNSFPEKQVFACNLVDSNNFCVCGYIYGNHKYGAVLYLAFNDCGIVKCNNGTFSATKL